MRTIGALFIEMNLKGGNYRFCNVNEEDMSRSDKTQNHREMRDDPYCRGFGIPNSYISVYRVHYSHRFDIVEGKIPLDAIRKRMVTQKRDDGVELPCKNRREVSSALQR